MNPVDAFLSGIPHRGLHEDVNCGIVQSEIEGGVYLPDLPKGSCLELVTLNHRYLLVHEGEGRALICGHPGLCPEPVDVWVAGSTWCGSLLKTHYVGRGMRLEFQHPVHNLVTTSPILTIHQR